MCALLGKVTIKYEIYPICQKECADIRQKKTETKKEAVSYDTASLVYDSLYYSAAGASAAGASAAGASAAGAAALRRLRRVLVLGAASLSIASL